MAIYLRGGMPITLTAADRKTFWRMESKHGNVKILSKEPSEAEIREAFDRLSAIANPMH